MTKVCVINPNYWRSSGVTHAIRKINQLAQPFGVDQYFVSCGYGEFEDDIDWVQSDRYVRFRLMARNPLTVLHEVKALVKWLHRHQIRIIHIHHRRLAVALSLLRLFGPFRIIYTGHLVYPFSFLFWITATDAGTAVTDSVRQNMRQTTRLRCIPVIGNSVHFPEACPSIPVAAVRNHALCIARLEPVKGHMHLIDAWKILKDRGKGYQLTLAGEGPLQKTLQCRVKALGLEDLITFAGFCPDVSCLLEKSLFAILVSEIEGQGIVTIEAASCGRPTLLTKVPGSVDCLPPNIRLVNGLPFGDPYAIADAVEAWFQSPAGVVADGELFFQFHQQRNSDDLAAEAYVKLYQEIAYG